MNPLQTHLRQLRRRLLILASAAGLSWGVVAGLLALLAGMWLDLALELPPHLRLAWSLAALAVGLALLTRTALLALRRAHPASLARRLDQVAATHGQILSGIDLAHSPNPSQPVTLGLAQLAIDRATTLAATIAPHQALPNQPLHRPCTALGLLLLALGLLWLLSPRLAGTQWARFADPFGDHPPYSRITLHVEPGHARVVYGTGLDIRASALGPPVDRLEVVLQTSAADPEVVPMFQEPNGQWRTTIANVVSPGSYIVRGGGTRSRRFNLDLITVPRLESVRVRVTPPSYTNSPTYDGQIPQGGLAVLPGTRVEIIARSNRPLSAGLLEITPEGAPTTRPAMPPLAPGAQEVAATFIVDKPGRFSLKVVDAAGQVSTQSLAAAITLLSDERPFVRLLQPLASSFATPATTLPVEAVGEDDYGVVRVQVYRSLNDSRALPQDFEAPKPAPVRLPARSTLPLAALGLNPGDVIKLYARVEDNDPAGIKGSESPVSVVRIISEEDYQRMLLARQGMEVLQSKYEQARRRLEAIDREIENIQKEIKKLQESDALKQASAEQIQEFEDALRQLFKELADKMHGEAREIDKAARQDLPFDIDKALREELGKVSGALREGRDEARRLAGQKDMKVNQMADALDQVRQKLGQQAREFQQNATEPLEHLARIYALLEDEARFVELYQRQRDLEQRLASIKDRQGEDDPRLKARMRDLEAEQRQVREELGRLLNDIESHARELPEKQELAELRQTGLDFAKAVRQSQALEEMAGAESGLAEFSGPRGHGGAKRAADILAGFLNQCQGMQQGGKACLKFSPKLESSLGNTVEQLLEAAGLSSGTSEGGQGMGGGGQGGYSARRSTLQNVGLYGGLPTRAQWAGNRGGQADRGRSTGGRGDDPSSHDSAEVSASEKDRAAGQSDAQVPTNYRRRVSDYFRRVADELEQ